LAARSVALFGFAIGASMLQRHWSDALAWHLLAALPDTHLCQWGPADSEDLRHALLGWAREDADVRGWILGAWRELHPEAVAAADELATAGMPPDAGRILDVLTPEETLVAFLTDDCDDGHELAQAFLSKLCDDRRRDLQVVLKRLLGQDSPDRRRRIRVAIMGGHPRDESRLDQRLFESSPFEVRWRTFEKKPSSGIVQRGVVGLLRNADALVIITGMASHMLMQFAKDFAQRNGIPFRCIEKATETRLHTALRQMFPESTMDWP
jgi:Uncharacterized protein conserved in bacteria (DUF2325)